MEMLVELIGTLIKAVALFLTCLVETRLRLGTVVTSLLLIDNLKPRLTKNALKNDFCYTGPIRCRDKSTKNAFLPLKRKTHQPRTFGTDLFFSKILHFRRSIRVKLSGLMSRVKIMERVSIVLTPPRVRSIHGRIPE